MLFSHIEDFLEIKGESAGLGFWCEQAFESCHHDFKVSFIYFINFFNIVDNLNRLIGKNISS